ncbi:adenylate/guanylate cyclase domain-containing protein [Dongia deserti]|uniref:adenylate/guanylate cyclase domain-containing protein n=1 Tax=Dongia deserti TaxID=2268030 RepID=UPI000E655698|nr:adenylate/guanylate cyclase domain-containing protein [Dongia deserti]
MIEQHIPRRLAAILAADVVGYCRLMEQDERGTLAALKARRNQILEPLVAEHHGRIFKLMGDGVLVEFGSAVHAVECAIALQRAMTVANDALPEDRRIVLRIGISLGDIMIEGSDLYGDTVNVAARLQGLAQPGAILLSATVHDYVRGKINVAFDDLGAANLRNLVEPVRLYRVADVGGANVAARHPTIGKPSIAVMPFVNLSGDPEQEYFSDGITEELITSLAFWRSFPVIARSSTFTYKGKAIDVTRIARELGARYIVEGSVRRSSGQIRVTAQMIDGRSGHHVWAARYDCVPDDIFALQDQLAHRIAATIVPELERLEIKRACHKRPADLDAWDLYLRGLSFLQSFTREGNAQARDMFERAIALDSEYADAYAGLAVSYHRDLLLECAADRNAAIEKSASASHRAVALDPASSNAHAALATAYLWRNEHALSLDEARRALELNPSDAQVLHAWGNKADLAGDPEGLPAMEQAQKLNPQDPDRHSHLCFLARAYVNARRYEEAVACARAAIERQPSYPHAQFVLAIALGHLGRAADARAALDRCSALHPGFIAGRTNWRPYLSDAANEHLRDGLRKIGFQIDAG